MSEFLPGVELDDEDCSVTRNGVTVNLTSCQYRHFKALYLRKGRCLSKNTLLDIVYGQMGEPTDECVDQHIWMLRRRVKRIGLAVPSRRSVGYYLADAQAP